MSKMKLSYRYWLDRVQSRTKTKQDNNMTNRIGLVYVEIETELSGPIWLGVVFDKNKTWQWCD